MKLNYKRTIFVGFAFFLICAFWQAYDNTIPLILTNKFGLSQTASGAVMALDNVLALFLLPLFGAISDRCHSKRGKRTPFILIGTIAAAVIFVGLSFADGAQLKNLSTVSQIDDPAAMQVIYTQESEAELQTPDGTAYRLSALFTEEEFVTIPSQLVATDGMIETADGTPYALADRFTEAERTDIDKHNDGKAFTNPHYTDYVVPARLAYAWNQTAADPTALIVYCTAADGAALHGDLPLSSRCANAGCDDQAAAFEGKCCDQSDGQCGRHPDSRAGHGVCNRLGEEFHDVLYAVLYRDRARDADGFGAVSLAGARTEARQADAGGEQTLRYCAGRSGGERRQAW